MKKFVVFSTNAVKRQLTNLGYKTSGFRDLSGHNCGQYNTNSRFFTIMKYYLDKKFTSSYIIEGENLDPLIFDKLSDDTLGIVDALEVKDEENFRTLRVAAGIWVTNEMRLHGITDSCIDDWMTRAHNNGFRHTREEIEESLHDYISKYSIDLEIKHPEGSRRDYLWHITVQYLDLAFKKLA